MGSFGISEGNITERGKKKKKCLSTTPSREVAQVLASTRELDKEVRVAFLG